MKIIAISDLHGELPQIPPCDLLLIAGDICPVYNHSVEFQWNYLGQDFNNWLDQIEATQAVWIGGNHDFVLEQYPLAHMDVQVGHYLLDKTITIEGMQIHGSPWTPQFFDWAFMKDDEDLTYHWDMIPENVDILMTHGPPLGILDQNGRGVHCGSKTLWERTQKNPARLLHVFGHIHEGFGVDGIYANVAILGRDYKPHGKIFEIEL
jgi:Icc-related predicted phosphoesterase